MTSVTVVLPDGTSADVAAKTLSVLDKRAAALGGSAAVSAEGADAIDVSVPALGGPAVLHALVQIGELTFRPVLAEYPEPGGPALTADPNADATMVASATDLGSDKAVAVLLGPVGATGTVVESTSAGRNQAGQWEIRPILKTGPQGIDQFNAMAGQCQPPSAGCPTGRLAVLLDDKVQTAPTIQVPAFERDQITMSGNYTETDAKVIAILLDSGPLPAVVQVRPA